MDLGDGAEAKIQLFQNYGHVAYQIKGNDACSNMVANILPVDTPSTSEVGSKGLKKNLLKVVKLHIKLKGMEHRAPCKHIFCPYTHSRPMGLGQKVKTFF